MLELGGRVNMILCRAPARSISISEWPCPFVVGFGTGSPLLGNYRKFLTSQRNYELTHYGTPEKATTIVMIIRRMASFILTNVSSLPGDRR